MSSDAGCADLIPASGASLARATSYTAWMKEKRARQTTNQATRLGFFLFPRDGGCCASNHTTHS